MRKETVSIFEKGDVVLFQTGENGLKSNIGMILKHKENGNYAILSVYSSAYKDVKPSWIASVNDVENIRNEITSHYEENISELQSKIRKPTQEEKESFDSFISKTGMKYYEISTLMFFNFENFFENLFKDLIVPSNAELQDENFINDRKEDCDRIIDKMKLLRW